MITSVLVDYFLVTLRFIITPMQLTVYFASYLWRCYSETRGLHTATLTATSSSSLNRAEA